MTTLRPLALSLVSLATPAAAFAQADALLDHIPADAPLYVLIPDALEMVGEVREFLAATGQAEAGQVVAVAKGVMETPGIGNGVALLITEPLDPFAGVEAEGVILVEVDNYGQMSKALGGGDADANGVAEINMFGESFFVRDGGRGVAIIGMDAESVGEFEPAVGLADAHRARLGSLGDTLLENHVSIVTYMPAVADGLKQLVAMGRGQLQDMALMMGPQGAIFQEDMVFEPTGAFLDQAEATTVGMTFSDAGVFIDVSAQFKEGSEIGGFFADGGSTKGLLNRVPDEDFLFAAASDSSSESYQRFMDKAEEFGAAINEAIGEGGDASSPDLLEPAGGAREATLVARNPQGIMAGMLVRSVRYIDAERPQDLIDRAETKAQQMVNEETKAGPFTIEASLSSAGTVAGVEAKQFRLGMIADPGDPTSFQAAQGLQMMYGFARGPAGYIAPAESGVVQTLTAGDTGRLEQALAVANSGKGLGSGDRLGPASDMLPDNRIFEGYMELDTLYQEIIPLAGMFLGELPFDAPADLPPLGMSVSTGGGGMFARVALPASFVEWTINTAEALDAADALGAPGGGAPQF